MLALLAALLLPVWERDRVSSVSPTWSPPTARTWTRSPTRKRTGGGRQRARAGSRLARTNALASLDRARAEPVVARSAVDLAEGVLANSHRVVHALMTMDTLRSAAHETARLHEFLRACSQALAACERAVRDGDGTARDPAVARTAGAGVPRAARERQDTAPETVAALADATDRLANGIDTLAVGPAAPTRRELRTTLVVRSRRECLR